MPANAYSGPGLLLDSLATFQALVFEIGRHSSISDGVALLASLSSSWAWYFFERFTTCR